jgi:hypothetical protein
MTVYVIADIKMTMDGCRTSIGVNMGLRTKWSVHRHG